MQDSKQTTTKSLNKNEIMRSHGIKNSQRQEKKTKLTAMYGE